MIRKAKPSQEGWRTCRPVALDMAWPLQSLRGVEGREENCMSWPELSKAVGSCTAEGQRYRILKMTCV